MSDRKTQSNRTNALQSTGPVTVVGKARASQNAIQHGILSAKLLLPSESPNEFAALLSQLQVELVPVGTLECVLVERIAIAIWRQRRLIGAEAAKIQVQQQSLSASELIYVLADTGLTLSDHDWIKEVARAPPDQASLQADLDELDLPDHAGQLDWPTFLKKYPRAWQDMCEEAELPEGLPAAGQLVFVQDYLGGIGTSLGGWYIAQSTHLRKLLRLVNALLLVRQAATMPVEADVLARYQSALDNDVYKATRALREQQKFRLDQAAMTAAPIE